MTIVADHRPEAQNTVTAPSRPRKSTDSTAERVQQPIGSGMRKSRYVTTRSGAGKRTYSRVHRGSEAALADAARARAAGRTAVVARVDVTRTYVDEFGLFTGRTGRVR